MEDVGLTNIYLIKLLRDKLAIKKFVDVFSADTIPFKLLVDRQGKEKIFIANTATLAEKGEHFICILVQRDELTIYDSLALNLQTASPEIFSVCKKSGKKITLALSRPIQAETSAFCGVYCIYFVLMLCPEQFPNRLKLKKFNKSDLTKNDDIVLNNVTSLINSNET